MGAYAAEGQYQLFPTHVSRFLLDDILFFPSPSRGEDMCVFEVRREVLDSDIIFQHGDLSPSRTVIFLVIQNLNISSVHCSSNVNNHRYRFE